ncbi:hypothetical protein HYU19_04820 [Candidatus Woesearchaeota archaeon]|nr:hypothetical protein [Candidatus Woesearchaeota archaeon]
MQNTWNVLVVAVVLSLLISFAGCQSGKPPAAETPQLDIDVPNLVGLTIYGWEKYSGTSRFDARQYSSLTVYCEYMASDGRPHSYQDVVQSPDQDGCSSMGTLVDAAKLHCTQDCSGSIGTNCRYKSVFGMRPC